MSQVTVAEPTSPGSALIGRRPGWSDPERGSFLPTWGLISTKLMELRKRRGLMIAVVFFTVGAPVLILGLRLLFHAVDPKAYGPAGSPDMFNTVSDLIGEFGFIVAATLGAAAGTTDLTEGMFRQLVITGRSRLALFFARIPAGMAILTPLVAVGFGLICLVTSYAGIAQPRTVNLNGTSVPVQLSEAQLETWLLLHPQQAVFVVDYTGPFPSAGGGAVAVGPPSVKSASSIATVRADVRHQIASIDADYASSEVIQANPAINEMVKAGLWLELVVAVGFIVGLGLGTLTGQRTVSTIVMIALQLIVTPILARNVIPYFINGQRLVVGVALDQLRPMSLGGGVVALGRGGGGSRHGLLAGSGGISIPPMPTWAMVSVIVGWFVVWTAVGAWKTVRRDA